MTATNAYIEVNAVTFGEFLKYFGLWLLMENTIASFNRRYWFDDSYQPSMWQGSPFRLGHYMTGYCFDQITSALRFTIIEYPIWRYRVHQVMDLIKYFNDHMKIIFIPGWISCLDESMSLWTIQWTCPGWIFCPRKPQPYVNEYHSICDEL